LADANVRVGDTLCLSQELMAKTYNSGGMKDFARMERKYSQALERNSMFA
jgi:hypothetical protein